jgi:triacylglycerol lipase
MAPLQHAILFVVLFHVLATSAAGWLPFKFALPEALQWPATTLDRTATSTWDLEAPSVLIGQGMIVGAVLRDASAPQTVEAFRGIPYALPPVGDRRFKPAIPIGKSQDIVNATRFGFRCVDFISSTRLA